MNSEYLRAMSAKELDAYAQYLGFSAKAAKTANDKFELISKRREKVAELSVIGVQVSIPVKRAQDRRFTALINKPERTEQDIEHAFELLLGAEQFEEIQRAATDDDGTVDEAALSYAYNSLLTADELKNF